MTEWQELDRLHEEDENGNWTTRTQFSVEDGLKRERFAADAGFSAPYELLKAWRDNTDKFDLRTHMAETDDVAQWTGLIVVANPDPLQYQYSRHVSGPFGAFTGEMLQDVADRHPFPQHVVSTTMEYLHCKLTMQPTYYQIEQTVEGKHFAYTRAVVPLLDKESGNSSELAYAIRQLNASATDKSEASQPIAVAVRR